MNLTVDPARLRVQAAELATNLESLRAHAAEALAAVEQLVEERDLALRGFEEASARAEALALERDKFAAFKAFVHKRLDEAGVPADPPGPHRDAGCRIGQRLDVVLGASPACEPAAAGGEENGEGVSAALPGASTNGAETAASPVKPGVDTGTVADERTWLTSPPIKPVDPFEANRPPPGAWLDAAPAPAAPAGEPGCTCSDGIRRAFHGYGNAGQSHSYHCPLYVRSGEDDPRVVTLRDALAQARRDATFWEAADRNSQWNLDRAVKQRDWAEKWLAARIRAEVAALPPHATFSMTPEVEALLARVQP